MPNEVPTTTTEWRVVCADGYESRTWADRSYAEVWLANIGVQRGGGRVQSRTVTTSEWVDDA